MRALFLLAVLALALVACTGGLPRQDAETAFREWLCPRHPGLIGPVLLERLPEGTGWRAVDAMSGVSALVFDSGPINRVGSAARFYEFREKWKCEA